MKKFLCVGGPNAGEYMTEEEAGESYFRFNSSSGEYQQEVYVRKNDKLYRIARSKKRGITPKIWVPKSILVYCEEPEPIYIDME